MLLLALGMLEGFTGYLLPWDQTAYWATVVGINLNGTMPVIGPFLAQFLGGGAEIGADALSKFYSLHMLVIPGGIFALIGLHLYLVIRLGVTLAALVARGGRPRPARGEAADRRARGPRPARAGAEALRMASRRIEERRAQHKRYKEDVERTGKPFFPHAMFHDTVMSLVVVARDRRARVRLVLHRGGLGRPRLARAVTTPRRPTRARLTSSHGRTGTSTSSSTCSGSSSGPTRS